MAPGALGSGPTAGYPQAKPSGDATLRFQRVCLGCRTRFDSAWAGERICSRCKSTTVWRNGAALATARMGQTASRSGRKGAS